jgi:hypothetical protein
VAFVAQIGLTTPDLWEQAATMGAALQRSTSQAAPNDVFSSDEQRLLTEKLNQLESFVKTTERLRAKQAKQLNEGITYLVDASDRLGRKDWLNTFVGVLFSFVVSGIFSPNRAQELYSSLWG